MKNPPKPPPQFVVAIQLAVTLQWLHACPQAIHHALGRLAVVVALLYVLIRKWIKSLPELKNYQSISKFLFDYIEYQKSLDEKVSYRKISKELDWSISYFNEVIHGKRNLSINKGIELIKYLKLSDLEAERFVVLLLENTESEETRNHFNKILSKNYQRKTLSENFPELQIDTKIENEFLSDFSLILLFAFLRWSKTSFSKANIGNILYSCPDFKNETFLLSKLEKLRELDIIKITSDLKEETVVFEIKKENIFMSHTKQNIHHFEAYFNNQSTMITKPEFKGTVHGGFVKIHRAHFQELLDRTAMLKNWILYTEQETKNCDKEDLILIQYDLSLMLAMNTEALGIKDFKTWLNSQ